METASILTAAGIVLSTVLLVWKIMSRYADKNEKAHTEIGENINRVEEKLEDRMGKGFEELRGYLVNHLEHHNKN